jgi:hypothetical protein
VPPADLLDDLRRHRDAVAAELAARSGAPADAVAIEAARLLRLTELGFAALAERDPDLDAERALMAEVVHAEAAGLLPVKPAADHRDNLAGLQHAALQRPPSWADAGAVPSSGAWCGCCSRHRPEAGRRWWAAVEPRTDGCGIGLGWACRTCHPPPPGCEVLEVTT